jgi:Holliday junction DNA helicase RuvB
VNKTVKQLLKEKEDQRLRPQLLQEYVGQSEVKESLKIAIEAARIRGKPIDHILIYGPPGMGKTTIASIVANEMQRKLWRTSGPALTSPRDLATVVATLETGDVLFIDEIHRLSPTAEELLYPVMEDFHLHITLGKGLSAQVKEIPLQMFTLVGATTRAGLLTSPLRDRFGLVFRLGYYSATEIVQILERSARIYGVKIDSDCARAIATRSRYTPRIANRLLKRTIDYALARNKGLLNRAVVEETFRLMKIDTLGLDEMDRKLLLALAEKYGGGPLGIESMCAILGEDRDTVEDVYEPYLIQSGLLDRTPRGRMLTEKAKRHLKMDKGLNLFAQ